jgi:enoyl-CoA hydratase/carnithine racemase
VGLAGGTLSADRAHALGLVNEVHPEPADAVAAALELAARIVKASPTAIRRTFELQRALAASVDEAEVLTLADKAVEQHMTHPDASEGPAAWLEKRAPQWVP